MLSIDLDPARQKRLDELAKSQGQDGATLAQRIVVDFLDFQALAKDSESEWADASVALTPEIMDEERWDDADHGS